MYKFIKSFFIKFFFISASYFSLLFSLQAQANVPVTFSLSGVIEQGGLIVGKTSPGSKVTLNEQLLRVSSQGDFVFGFGRDDTRTYILSVVATDGSTSSKELTPSKRQYKIDRVEGISQKIMKPNVKNIERAQQDRLQVKKARAIASDLTDFTTGFTAPRDSKITGVYGSQRFFNGQPKSPHYGVDYRGKVGAPVHAPAGGIVTLWQPDMFYSGGTLIIDHGFGVNSTFLHLSQSHVKVGQRIEKGQLIAAVGKSGRANGPHLDWRVNWFHVRTDPMYVLEIQPL
jgi:murein DD-endopeptidase MepM/ murein hydrolase activator NlpD